MATDAIQCHGLWVPAFERTRFIACTPFEGIPDLDVSKNAKCTALLSERRVALDIGAHVGAVSLYLGRIFDRVIAFEAVPETYQYLALNTANIANVEAMNSAVGPAPGEVYFDHYLKHGQLSHVSSGSADTQKVGPIPVLTIDSFNLSNVDYIKIDVEGYELPVLQGASETILRCRPMILVEQGGNDELHFGAPRNEASAFLEDIGMVRHSQAPRMNNDRLYIFPTCAAI
jgi:FkbM family methyltransferase